MVIQKGSFYRITNSDISIYLSAVFPVWYNRGKRSFNWVLTLLASTVCICFYWDSINWISCNGCKYDKFSMHLILNFSGFNMSSVARRIKLRRCKWQYKGMCYGIHWQPDCSALKWVAIVTRWMEISQKWHIKEKCTHTIVSYHCWHARKHSNFSHCYAQIERHMLLRTHKSYSHEK